MLHMCNIPNIHIILFCLILHLNKEPFESLVSHSSIARCLTLVTLVKSVVHLTEQRPGSKSNQKQNMNNNTLTNT